MGENKLTARFMNEESSNLSGYAGDFLTEHSFLRENTTTSETNPLREQSMAESVDDSQSMTDQQKQQKLQEMEQEKMRFQQEEHAAKQRQEVFDLLREQTQTIEENFAQGEHEVLDKTEMAFLMRQHQLEMSNLQEQHVFCSH
jgi:hypothetical protein